ncbi:acyl-CoA binding domain-containing protein 6 [Halocaridina rubra]|uniref:Acyl-CoA-binding domain-containing protein 6 n=1 Tax=Halocaridina rubra TaxID=373956 RepID=A0AAN8XPH4_HALRR
MEDTEEYFTPREDIEKAEELDEDLREFADQGNELESTFAEAAGKRKWEAWNALEDMSNEVAMKEYVEALDRINPDWQSTVCDGGRSRSWITVSSLAATDENEKRDEDKDDFDWVKENNIERIRNGDTEVILSARDENGMTVLHWAADRGYVDMTEVLLEKGFSVNIQDESGQTPLHYAASCGHLDLIKLLLSNGAHTTIVDSDGTLPVDCAEDQEIRMLLQ